LGSAKAGTPLSFKHSPLLFQVLLRDLDDITPLPPPLLTLLRAMLRAMLRALPMPPIPMLVCKHW
jgi:hypothetical protein